MNMKIYAMKKEFQNKNQMSLMVKNCLKKNMNTQEKIKKCQNKGKNKRNKEVEEREIKITLIPQCQKILLYPYKCEENQYKIKK